MFATHPIPLQSILPKKLAWIWPGYIPKGAVTVLDGDPNLGKSLTTIDLAARLSRGQPLPDGSDGTVGRTLIIQAEDSTANTVVPRLQAAGADLDKIFVLPNDAVRILRLPRNLRMLERFIRDARSDYVVIDPFFAFLSRNVWCGNDQAMRAVLSRLATVAAQTDCAIQLIRHLNKTNGQKAMYRGRGSISIAASARSVLLVATHPSMDGAMILASTKNNLGPAPSAFGYRIVETETGAPKIEWTGPVDRTADEALLPALPVESESPLEIFRAMDWLTGILNDGPRPAIEMLRAAQGNRISERTLERAKVQLGVESKAWVDEKTGKRRWVWQLVRPVMNRG